MPTNIIKVKYFKLSTYSDECLVFKTLIMLVANLAIELGLRGVGPEYSEFWVMGVVKKRKIEFRFGGRGRGQGVKFPPS